MYKLFLLGLVSVAAAKFDYRTAPGLNYNTWWGRPGKQVDDPEIIDFKIEYQQKDIDLLMYYLENRRDFVPSLDGVAYNYGVNTQTIGYWLDYWQNSYNFTEREVYMNQFPHKKSMIQGLWIHFIHIKPEVPEGKFSIPVLMLHGFPGSIREFYDAIPLITADSPDRDYVVELIVPSLPGFGFSDYTNKTGLGAAEMGFIFKNLMHKLGHDKFYIQGGDWGALIAGIMVTIFPDTILGHHTNMGVAYNDEALAMLSAGSVDPGSIVPAELISRLYPLEDSLKYMAQESGYFHMHATKPDTVGILVNSPAGLMSWLFQQFSIASRRANINDTRGGLDLYTPEQLLDNLMIYWCEHKGPTSFRIYAETFNLRNERIGYRNEPSPVPTFVVQAADEIFYMPPAMLRTKFVNLVDVKPLDNYGHFLAFEAPEAFTELFFEGFKKIMEFRKTYHMDDVPAVEKTKYSSCVHQEM